MSRRDWFLVGLLAVAGVVIYNLLQPTSVTTTETDGTILADPAEPAATPGGAQGVSLFGAGPYTETVNFRNGGLAS